MSETTGSDESVVAAVLTTPEEWRGFLKQYDARYLKDAEEEEWEELLEEDQLDALDKEERLELWLGEAPAREDVLVASEERLGVRFPPSLRGFFLASDGWTRVEGWVECHPCDSVVWMRDGDSGSSLIEMYDSSGVEVEDLVRLFRRSIEVAQGEDFWLLDPTDVGPDGEWAAYEFQPKYGDLTKFPSFFALFHSGYESMGNIVLR